MIASPGQLTAMTRSNQRNWKLGINLMTYSWEYYLDFSFLFFFHIQAELFLLFLPYSMHYNAVRTT